MVEIRAAGLLMVLLNYYYFTAKKVWFLLTNRGWSTALILQFAIPQFGLLICHQVGPFSCQWAMYIPSCGRNHILQRALINKSYELHGRGSLISKSIIFFFFSLLSEGSNPLAFGPRGKQSKLSCSPSMVQFWIYNLRVQTVVLKQLRSYPSRLNIDIFSF